MRPTVRHLHWRCRPPIGRFLGYVDTTCYRRIRDVVSSTAGHATPTAVRHTLSMIVLASAGARFRMSTPTGPGLLTETCTGELPATMFRRIRLPETAATMKMPFVLPVTMLSVITLSLAPAPTRPMPKLFS